MTPMSWGGGAAGQPSCPTGGARIPPPAAGGRQIHSYSYPPRGAGSGGCQARQEEGVRTPLGDPRPVPGAEPTHPCVEAERAVPEMASMSLNNWYKCSPKPDHFLLPPQRKQRWKEAQSQGGRDSTRRVPVAGGFPGSTCWELVTWPRVQLSDKPSVPGPTRGVSLAKHPNTRAGAAPASPPQ